jgi:hypothetical protein
LTLDLSALPERRRARVLDAYQREAAAERIRAVYPLHLARWKKGEALRRTAEQMEREGYAWVTARWAQRVIWEDR